MHSLSIKELSDVSSYFGIDQPRLSRTDMVNNLLGGGEGLSIEKPIKDEIDNFIIGIKHAVEDNLITRFHIDNIAESDRDRLDKEDLVILETLQWSDYSSVLTKEKQITRLCDKLTSASLLSEKYKILHSIWINFETYYKGAIVFANRVLNIRINYKVNRFLREITTIYMRQLSETYHNLKLKLGNLRSKFNVKKVLQYLLNTPHKLDEDTMAIISSVYSGTDAKDVAEMIRIASSLETAD